MAVGSESSHLEEQQVQLIDDEEDIDHHVSASHHPSAPSDELFDISTTVDPSFLISLIRKLLPPDTRNSNDAHGVGACNDSSKESKTDVVEDEVANITNNIIEAMDAIDEFEKQDPQKGSNDGFIHRDQNRTVEVGEDVWEENGCILWDLSASKTHAEFMTENLVIEVLSANLMVSQSSRIKEIILGIFGNLACHEVPRKQIAATKGLIEIIVDQLFLDDTPCLCEACRLIALGLQGGEFITWAEALQTENVVCRILWIAENTLNLQLIEKTIGLVLAVLKTQQEVMLILLPPLMKFGLPSLLTSLLAFEMGKLTSQRISDRYPVLDIILRAIEALSVIDGYSQEICLNVEIFQLICNLIKLPDKAEVADSCVTAAVLCANILSEASDLASAISCDLPFLQGLFDIFIFASDDSGALNALWSIIARLLVQVHESEITSSRLEEYVLLLVTNADLIEEKLIDGQLDEFNQHESRSIPYAKENARAMALRRIISILNQWNWSTDRCAENEGVGENHAIIVERLLLVCRKYTK